MRFTIPSLPMQLIAVIGFVFFAGPLLSLGFVEGSYTFSIIFKELLGLILPFMVFFFVLDGILSFKKNAPLVLAIMLGTIFFSNGLVALCSYGIMQIMSPIISCDSGDFALEVAQEVNPFFVFSLPFTINAVHALLSALIIGLIGSFYSLGIDDAVSCGKNIIEWILCRIVIPFLPLYVLGFALKIRYEGMFACLVQQYGGAFVLIIMMQVVCLIIMYLFAFDFDPKKAIQAIRNVLPSYITAFTTMSSVVAIPDSIKAAVKNTRNRPLANVAIPIMANVHLVGASIAIPILAMVTMLIYQGALPTFMQYAWFIFYFCFSMFAVSGIPGGGILVMIPVLKSYLGFTPEMVGIILTIYFLLDSFGTAANVMGDGALVIIVNRILRKLKIVQ